jgi:hypothetical protein
MPSGARPVSSRLILNATSSSASLASKRFLANPAHRVAAASLLQLRLARCFFQISMCMILAGRAPRADELVPDDNAR